MSTVLTYPQQGKDVGQAHDQLRVAGLVPELVQSDGTTITFLFPDGTSEAAVDAIIAAHIPQARYDPATLLRERAPLLRENRRRATFRRVREAADGATADDLRRALLLLTDWLERETASP